MAAASHSPNLATHEDQLKLDELMQLCANGLAEDLKSVLDKLGEHVQTLLNQKDRSGTTPLHVACRHGNVACVKLLRKCKADANIWDNVRGYPPILCAVYNDHEEAVKLLVDSRACDVNCKSQYHETPLHLACLRANLSLVQYLVKQGAYCMEKDCQGNMALHYAAGSAEGSRVIHWLLGIAEVKRSIDCVNKFDETPAHRAAYLGLYDNLAVLRHHKADFSIKDSSGFTVSDLTRVGGNQRCYESVNGPESPSPPSPVPPPPLLTKEGKATSVVPISLSSDAILQSSSPHQRLTTQRSYSSEDPSYKPRPFSPELLPRRPSFTGVSRPLNVVSISRRDSGRSQRGSWASLQRSLSRRSGDEPSFYVTKDTADRISSNLELRQSCGLEEVVYDQAAYEPPPNIYFVHSEKFSLSKTNQHYYTTQHAVRLRINSSKIKEEKVEFCVAAAMQLTRSSLSEYAIVGPLCFISCRRRPCKVALSLPHALDLSSSADVQKSVVVLSTMSVQPSLKEDSPLFGPGEQTLTKLQGARPIIKELSVELKVDLNSPSLFAVGVRLPLPPIPATPPAASPPVIQPRLRCIMFVGHPVLDGSTQVSGFDLEVYIGMDLRTVTTSMSRRTGMKFHELKFTISSAHITVNASLTNPSADWTIERRDSGQLDYSQIALTRFVDTDSISHYPGYPPHTMFFIEPHNAVGAVKCNVSITDGNRELAKLIVVPYAPRRDVTPDPEMISTSRTQLIDGELCSQV